MLLSWIEFIETRLQPLTDRQGSFVTGILGAASATGKNWVIDINLHYSLPTSKVSTLDILHFQKRSYK